MAGRKLTAEKVDGLLENAGNALANVQAARGGDPEQVAKLEKQFLFNIGAIRDAMCTLLREHHCGKPTLNPIFGGDCVRLARVRELLENLGDLSEANAADQRIRNCQDACESVGRVVEQHGPRNLAKCPSHVEPTREPVVPVKLTALAEDGPVQYEAEEAVPRIHEEGEGEQDLDEAAAESAGLDRRGAMEQAVREAAAAARSNTEENAIPEDGNEHPSESSQPRAPKAEERTERPTHTFPNGSTYTGQWLMGRRDGEGIQVWPGGEKYEGQFVAGGVHGEGVYTQPDGLAHGGFWVKGRQHGFGSETFPDGTRYVGQYEWGVKSGNGTYTFVEGSIYEGQFADNRIDGTGSYIWVGGEKSGKKYHGQWSKNRMNGKGVFAWADGRRYDGQYENDQKHGEGSFVWPDGRRYAGQWVRGKQHGTGDFVDEHGREHSWEWIEGKPQLIGTL